MIGPLAKIAEPIVKVYKIENGFLIETASDLNDVHKYTFAKDASAIAEFVITAAARETLGIPKQQEMFTASEMGKEYHTEYAKARQQVTDNKLLTAQTGNNKGK